MNAWRRQTRQPTSSSSLSSVVGILLASIGWFASAGCHGGSGKTTPPAPLATPGVSASVAHRVGPPLARPTTGPLVLPAVSATDALSVTTRWTAVERMPAGKSLAPLASSARLIAVPTSTQPIATSGQLLDGVRLVAGEAVAPFVADVSGGKFGRTVDIGPPLRGALPPDVSAVFAIAQSDGGGRPVELIVYRPAAAAVSNPDGGRTVQVALSVADGSQRERMLLDPMPVGDEVVRLALVVPNRFPRSDARATLAVIEIGGKDDSGEHAEALARCVRELATPALASSRPATPKAADGGGLATALQTLSSDPRSARSALVYLAAQTGATLCGDVALAADDQVLASLARRVIDKAKTATNSATLGWALDSACFEELSALSASEKMAPELSAALTAYAGEAGRHAASLEQVVKGLSNRQQLEARLLAENLVYLEDASPAARVRAYDWLKSRDRAPAGYDPLASNKDRRAAIERAMPASASVAPAQPPALGGAK